MQLGKNVRIEPGAQVYEGCIIGDNCIIGANAVLRPRTRIGNNTIFGSLSCSEGDNQIGDDCTIHAQCHITKGVKIGNCVFIAPYFIATNTPEISDGKHGNNQHTFTRKPTIIEDYVRIGANVRMTPGHTIGHHSLIDQDCLITKDIPPYSHVRGGKGSVGRIIETIRV